MKVNLIVARSQNGIIGKDGNIPWHIPKDFRLFQQATNGHAVVMGRKTHDSLPGKLSYRFNIVVSKTMTIDEGVNADAIVGSLSEARLLAQDLGYGTLWVIGGERLYTEAMPIVDEMWITEVHTMIPYKLGDNVAKFTVDLDRSRWVQTRNDYHPEADGQPACVFDVWKRRSKPSLYVNDFMLYEPAEYIQKEESDEFIHEVRRPVERNV